ncbi:MAG: biotin/lipoyl-binding protein, partial [Flammeovirgaceae bacterium]
VVIFLLALPKLKLFADKDEAQQAIPQPGQKPKLMVEGLLLQASKLDNKLIVTGSVLANESLELKSESSGKITKLLFEEGKAVRKGSLLLEINNEEIQAQLQKQKYNQKL